MNSSSLAPPSRIGWVGLGRMGLPMARNLARAGYHIFAHDLSGETLARACGEIGAEAPSSLKALARDCTLVITMLPDGDAVRTVVLGSGPNGDSLLAGFVRGGILMDMSSSSPVGTRGLGAMLADRGIALLDAPVSGGVKKAADASLSVMAGGDAEVLARCRPVLEAIGKQIFLTGPLGSGHAMKALNNYVSAAGLAAAIEAVLAGQRFGLDAKNVVEILNASTGMNNSTLNKFHQFILSRTFNSGFSLDLMVKDLRTAQEVARATGSPFPFGEACVEAWSEAQSVLGPGADHTAVARYWEQLAGAELGGRKV